MPRTKSETQANYRDEVSKYVLQVMAARGWKKFHVAKELDVHHATIGRAIEKTHDTQFPTLMALAEHSGVPIPDSLQTAAIAMRMPVRPPPAAAVVNARVAEILNDTEDNQRRIFEELQRKFGRSS